MKKARVFWVGNSHALHLPKGFRFNRHKVRIRRHRNAIIVEPIASDWSWLETIQGPVDADFEQASEEVAPQQDRPVR